MRTVILAWLWLVPSLVLAGAARVQVQRDDDLYRLTVDTMIHAPARRVFDVLQDFDQLNRLHHTVEESRTLSRDENRARVYVRMRGCLLFFCRTLTQVVDFWPDPQGTYMLAFVDPAYSDFKYGRMRWELQAETVNMTRLRYQADLVPDFWIPPLIGPWVMKSQLTRMALDMTEELGQLAAAP